MARLAPPPPQPHRRDPPPFTGENIFRREGIVPTSLGGVVPASQETGRHSAPIHKSQAAAKARNPKKQQQDGLESDSSPSSKNYVLSYVDTLLDLQLPEENRKLNDGEMVSLCSEFLNGGTDTTSTALQWIMANLVKHPHIQAKLLEEISGVMGEGKKRRHPPGHFVLPHSVTQDTTFEGYDIPKNASLNFMVSEMNWNPKIWEDPMEFKPERFLNSKGNGDEVFDITGSREIKMMPFGAGRRICPGHGLAMLHLEYFVANLVWSFEWKAVEGDEVDLSEKQEFTVVMKNPLQVHLSPRWK
ncbi:Cytochrome P450 89A2 [Vitis vinifera]|uniref:Cytochrome P450 89A2 n=1 Tax=Vitis vinifera TaxID=29760 RepID=A0A438CEF5_VITVI|nr:Cytochrome P450 89A2 [Vitis vinifera]